MTLIQLSEAHQAAGIEIDSLAGVFSVFHHGRGLGPVYSSLDAAKAHADDLLNAPPRRGVSVEINGEYGSPEGSINIMDSFGEVVMWDSAEWTEDPSLIFAIAAYINEALTVGTAGIRQRITPAGSCPTCGQPLDDGSCTYAEMDEMNGIDHATGEEVTP